MGYNYPLEEREKGKWKLLSVSLKVGWELACECVFMDAGIAPVWRDAVFKHYIIDGDAVIYHSDMKVMRWKELPPAVDNQKGDLINVGNLSNYKKTAFFLKLF